MNLLTYFPEKAQRDSKRETTLSEGRNGVPSVQIHETMEGRVSDRFGGSLHAR